MSYTQQYFAQEKAIRAPGDEAGSSGLISSKRVEDRCRNGKVTCNGNYRCRGSRVESKVLRGPVCKNHPVSMSWRLKLALFLVILKIKANNIF